MMKPIKVICEVKVTVDRLYIFGSIFYYHILIGQYFSFGLMLTAAI